MVTGDLILTEILQGFRSDRDFRKAKTSLSQLKCFHIPEKSIAIRSAENFRFLRKKGIIIRKTNDMLIGTFCIEYNLPLLYNDRDFDPMKEYLGLKSLIDH